LYFSAHLLFLSVIGFPATGELIVRWRSSIGGVVRALAVR
jgi:hypothetical protein